MTGCLQQLLNRPPGQIFVRHTGISYQRGGKPQWGRFNPRQPHQVATTPTFTVHRLLVSAVAGRLPNLGLANHSLPRFARYLAGEERQALSLNRNNHGDFLLEVPDSRLGCQAVLEFLGWLEEQCAPAARKEGVCTRP